MFHRRAKHGRTSQRLQRARQSAVRLHVRVLPRPRLRPNSCGGHFAGQYQARRLSRWGEHWRRWAVPDGSGRHRHSAGDCRQRRVVSERRCVCRKAGGADGCEEGNLFPAHLAPQNPGDLQQRRTISHRRRQSLAPSRQRQSHGRGCGDHAVRSPKGRRCVEE